MNENTELKRKVILDFILKYDILYKVIANDQTSYSLCKHFNMSIRAIRLSSLRLAVIQISVNL